MTLFQTQKEKFSVIRDLLQILPLAKEKKALNTPDMDEFSLSVLRTFLVRYLLPETQLDSIFIEFAPKEEKINEKKRSDRGLEKIILMLMNKVWINYFEYLSKTIQNYSQNTHNLSNLNDIKTPTHKTELIKCLIITNLSILSDLLHSIYEEILLPLRVYGSFPTINGDIPNSAIILDDEKLNSKDIKIKYKLELPGIFYTDSAAARLMAQNSVDNLIKAHALTRTDINSDKEENKDDNADYNNNIDGNNETIKDSNNDSNKANNIDGNNDTSNHNHNRGYRFPKVLDMGCGTGNLILEIAEKLYESGYTPEKILNFHIKYVDIDPIALLIAKIRLFIWYIQKHLLHSSNSVRSDIIAGEIWNNGVFSDLLELFSKYGNGNRGDNKAKNGDKNYIFGQINESDKQILKDQLFNNWRTIFELNKTSFTRIINSLYKTTRHRRLEQFFDSSYRCHDVLKINLPVTGDRKIKKQNMDERKIEKKKIDERKTYASKKNASKTMINSTEIYDEFYTNIDLIISNPPYKGEGYSKDIMHINNQSDSLKQFYNPRMDLYLYFIARALELIGDNGIITFITPPYFLKNENAQKIRSYLYRNMVKMELFDFGNLRIFDKAQGVHSVIFTLYINKNLRINQQGFDNRKAYYHKCLIKESSEYYRNKNRSKIRNKNRNKIENKNYDYIPFSTKIFPLDRIFLDKSSYLMNFETDFWDKISERSALYFEYLLKLNNTISDFFQIKQGVVAGPDRIRKRQLISFNKENTRIDHENSESLLKKGEPVFILPIEKINAMGLNPEERKLLKPFVYTKDIPEILQKISAIKLNAANSEFNEKSNLINTENTMLKGDLFKYYIIYLDRNSILDENGYPNIYTHLYKYKTILEQRREVKKGTIKWYHLHWPRTTEIFIHPRIIIPRRTKKPVFYYTERFFLTDLSTNIIYSKKQNDNLIHPLQYQPESLFFLYIWLNSEVIKHYITIYAKNKANILQIDGNMLENIPIIDLNDRKYEKVLEKCRMYLQEGTPKLTATDEVKNTIIDEIFSALKI